MYHILIKIGNNQLVDPLLEGLLQGVQVLVDPQ